MKIGDLVKFCPDDSIARAPANRPLGIVVQVGVVHPGHWDKGLQAVKVLFPGSNTPCLCKAKDFEVISENR
jgi:hypothetical protein